MLAPFYSLSIVKTPKYSLSIVKTSKYRGIYVNSSALTIHPTAADKALTIKGHLNDRFLLHLGGCF